MYKTFEAAKKRREELVENQIHEDHFDMYPLDKEWVLAYLHTEDQKFPTGIAEMRTLTLTGILLAPDERIDKDVRQFDYREDFTDWIDHFDEAVAEFVRVMSERRYEEYEKYLRRPC